MYIKICRNYLKGEDAGKLPEKEPSEPQADRRIPQRAGKRQQRAERERDRERDRASKAPPSCDCLYPNPPGTMAAQMEVQKEDKTHQYIELQCAASCASSEGIFVKYREELEKKVTLFRRVSLGLGVLCLLLLIAVAGLCVKALHPEPCASPEAQTDITLMTQRSSNKKSEIDQPGDGSVMDCQGGLCHLCRKGWLFFDGSCYFFSRDRLTWQESVEDCSRQKAELLVIASEKVQDFVTKKGTLFYWIGLQRDSSGTWAWINGDKLTVGYWVTPETPGASRESCVALKGRDDNRHNWNTANCEFNAFRVCRHTPRLPSN